MHPGVARWSMILVPHAEVPVGLSVRASPPSPAHVRCHGQVRRPPCVKTSQAPTAVKACPLIQAVEAPERVLDRQYLETGPSGLPGDPPQGAWPHHRAGCLAIRFDAALRQAPEDAGGGEEGLDQVAGGWPGLGAASVHDDDRAAGCERRLRGGERLDRPPEVVHAFEEQDQVTAADGLPRPRVGEVEGDPVVDVMFLGVAPGALDRCEVAVEPLDPDERIGLGQFDGGPADATADVSDQGGL